MEIKITSLFNATQDHSLDSHQFSDSISHSGLQNIGEVTWNNAKERATDKPLVTSDAELAELMEYFLSFGAWTREELERDGDVGLNAMLLQEISHNIQEFEMFESWDEYYAASKEGTVSGHLFKCDIEGDENEGDVFIYIGH